MVRLSLAFVAVVALAVACFPPPLDETFLLCDDTRPCDTGYVCFDGLCQHTGEVDAGLDNWLLNPSFENTNDAGTQALNWARGGNGSAFVSKQQAHTGILSELVFSIDGGNPQTVSVPTPVINTLAGQTWCARAWVKGNTDDGGVTGSISIRERDYDGGYRDNVGPRQRAGTQDWVMVTTQVTKGATPSTLEVRIGFGLKPDPSQLLWVDDAQLKRSLDETCTW
jgi:hypothetical protein